MNNEPDNQPIPNEVPDASGGDQPVPQPAPFTPQPEVQPQAEPQQDVQPDLTPHQPEEPTPFAAAYEQPTPATDQPIVGSGAPAPKKSNKKMILIIAAVVVLLLAAAGTAWALSRGNSDDTGKKSDANTSIPASDDADEEIEEDELEEEASVPNEKKQINQRFEDTDMGHTVNVISAERGAAITPEARFVALEGKVFVIVEVEADVTNRKYTGSITDSHFRLIDAAGERISHSNTVLSNQIKEAGLTPFTSTSSSAPVHKGVLVFGVEPDQVGSLKLRFERSAGRVVMGGSGQVAAFETDVVLW